MISLRIQDSNQCGIVTVHLEYFDSVKRLKEEIHLEMNMRVPPDQQLLFFQHQQLEDNFTLSQCGIMDNSLIVLKGWLYL